MGNRLRVLRDRWWKGVFQGAGTSALLYWDGDYRSFYGVALVITVTVRFSGAHSFPVLGVGVAGVEATILVRAAVLKPAPPPWLVHFHVSHPRVLLSGTCWVFPVLPSLDRYFPPPGLCIRSAGWSPCWVVPCPAVWTVARALVA